MRISSLATVVTIAALCVARAAAQSESFVPVTDAMLAHPDPSDWLHISRTYDEHRFSTLKQINKEFLLEKFFNIM